MFDAICKAYEKVCVAGLVVGMAFVLAQMGYGFFHVILRYVFNRPLPGVIEFTGEAMAYIVFLPAAYVQMHRRHVRIDFFYDRISPRGRDVLDVVAYAMGIVFFSLVVWYSIETAFHSLRIQEASFGAIPFPLYPQRFAVVVGVAMLAVQLMLDIVQPIRKLARRGQDDGGIT